MTKTSQKHSQTGAGKSRAGLLAPKRRNYRWEKDSAGIFSGEDVGGLRMLPEIADREGADRRNPIASGPGVIDGPGDKPGTDTLAVESALDARVIDDNAPLLRAPIGHDAGRAAIGDRRPSVPHG